MSAGWKLSRCRDRKAQPFYHDSGDGTYLRYEILTGEGHELVYRVVSYSKRCITFLTEC